MKEVIVAFVLALVVGAFINGFAVNGSAPTSTEPSVINPDQSTTPSTSSAVAETSDAGFDGDVLKASTPVLVDFYSENCAPCRQMAPIIDQVASEYGGKAKVIKLDVDSNPSVTMRYNVNTIPTFIVFKNGERGEAYTGLVPKGILAQSLDKALR